MYVRLVIEVSGFLFVLELLAENLTVPQRAGGAEIFDSSGMVALKKLHDRFEALGKVAALSSLSPTSRRIMEKSASMWEGVSFLEVEEIDEEALESIPSNIGPHGDM